MEDQCLGQEIGAWDRRSVLGINAQHSGNFMGSYMNFWPPFCTLKHLCRSVHELGFTTGQKLWKIRTGPPGHPRPWAAGLSRAVGRWAFWPPGRWAAGLLLAKPVNAWDRLCVGDKCSHKPQRCPRPYRWLCPREVSSIWEPVLIQVDVTQLITTGNWLLFQPLLSPNEMMCGIWLRLLELNIFRSYISVTAFGRHYLYHFSYLFIGVVFSC